ncbi:unnamed protein product [Adineta ricciae]|uniref:Uncharacterized protein n=1 Tax=Adineta ricciae TaxID=249248 RepID=A0A813X3B6_ADIRI|nr:unnamed protein product [Adineta ricciae]CAF1147664.1 unnamed protein product [Adineta ricciae]
MGTGKSVNVNSTKQSSTTAEHVLDRRRVTLQKVRSGFLICLNDNNKDWQRNIADLQRSIHNIFTFTECDSCIEFLQTINDTKACVTIVGSLGQQLVSRIHDVPQVETIFIFSDNKQRDESITKVWSKIKGIYTDIASLTDALKQAVQHFEQNGMPVSFVASTKNFDQLDLSFMYTHLLKEVILTSEFEERQVKEFTDYCQELFAGNDEELNDVKEFESKYHKETSIWWYTKDCFLKPMLNRTLRLMNGEIITRIGFFIADLHRQIEQLYTEQYKSESAPSGTFTVYYGQGFSKTDFEQLKKCRSGLISFNNFLLVNKNSKASLSFAQDLSTKGDLVGIMFVINVDPSQSSVPLAAIRDVSYSQTEDEFLFSMPSIFRINDIKRLTANNRLQEVHLTLVTDKDKDLTTVMNYIRQESCPEKEGWCRLGAVLVNMNYFDKAEQLYEFLLNQTKDVSEKAIIYYQLGLIEDKQEKYREAVSFYEKSLAICQKTPTTDQLDLAYIHYNIAMAYSKIDNNIKALSSHKEALKIREQLLPPDHIDLARSYVNIGLLYVDMNEYPSALAFFEKELAINQKVLSPNHPDLAVSYMDIGMVAYNTANYPKALASFEKALEIRQKTLAANDIALAELYNNIALVYNSMSEHAKALSHHEKALAIREKVLPKNHADFGASFNNIGVTYENMNNHAKACSFLERAIEVGERSLAPDDPVLQIRKDNLERIKKKM